MSFKNGYKTVFLISLIAIAILITTSIYMLVLLSNAQNTINMLREENSKLKTEVNILSTQLQTLDGENLQLKMKINELESKIYTLTNQINSLENELFKAYEEVNQLKNKLSNLSLPKIEVVTKSEDHIAIYGLTWTSKDNTTQILKGKVKNTGTKPIKRVYIIAGVYDNDEKVYLNWCLLTDLYINEESDFEIWFNLPHIPKHTKIRAFTVS
ncbi:MAG: hypothetical protein DRJ31_05590 [Candidatus Methanomethylicota archaeon]|uniref:Uncharacterized protein n=1 Tax=Thermoproteota archaeon TaxID=2056631 RepID=A0A497ERB3_9CREN|nr:MAG: hypothetical protein DRJ31_05590 [Candidatus Verstraetearchaeota archaeon]RLE52175.1 MAG: hypothetical protein DRJ33_04405 [Candidatus Verstraetearchaeota archaeon]